MENKELEKLDKEIPFLLERSNFDSSLGSCLENMFHITKKCQHEKIQETSAVSHCYFLSPRYTSHDLVDVMKLQILNFVIPRKELEAAKKSKEYTSELLRLSDDAYRRFIDYYKKKKILQRYNKTNKKTKKKRENGEAGEFLLFMLLEQIAKLPQAICKMNLKTNDKMPVHGSDGVHIGLSENKTKLALYYCESKVYKKWNKAIADCLKSISPILLGKKKEEGKELNLLTSYCDLGEENNELVNKLKDYFKNTKKKKDYSETRGACLIAFDSESCKEQDKEEIAKQISKEIVSWTTEFKEKSKSFKLENIFFHIFFIPMKDIVEFRKSFSEMIQGKRNEE